MKKFYVSMAVAALASVGLADTAVFNAMPSGTYFTTANGGAENWNTSGEYFALSGSNPISGFDLDFNSIGTSGTSNTYSDLQLQVSFFTSGNATWSDSGNEFSGLGVSQTYNLGAQTLAAGYYYDLASNILGTGSEVALTNHQAVTGGVIGVQFTFVNVVGGVATAVTGLQISTNASTVPTIGSNAQTQYGMTFASAGGTSSQTSLLESQYVYTGSTTKNNLAVELYAAPAPEPVSMTFLGLGAVGLIARKRRQAK